MARNRDRQKDFVEIHKRYKKHVKHNKKYLPR